MKVLLKRKKKRKGMSKYDPKPFIVSEIVGRQEVLERDGAKIRRETQKFKRFYSPEDKEAHQPEDDWEERSQRAAGKSQERKTKQMKNNNRRIRQQLAAEQ